MDKNINSKKNRSSLGLNFNNTYIDLPDKLYSKQNPRPVSAPRLVVLNKSLGKSLGLDINYLEDRETIDIFAGNTLPQGANPLAQGYAGHQFGNFTILGDGRAILPGEQVTPTGKRFDIQLKGSGKTPYSRGGDGRAALGPMLREYIISEGLYYLGIPTSRSLAVVTTGEKIMREDYLTGAILTRVASSHIRVGTFQFISNFGKIDELRALAEYTIERHFPEIKEDKNKFLLLLRKVVGKQAELIAKWQLVGFIHGVMNTDNMTISGESIDFGPCAFMDNYDPKTVFSSIDLHGRYAYGNQSDIGAWNLARFADSLLPLINKDENKAIEMARKEVENFYNIYNKSWLDGMRKKLGLFGRKSEDREIIARLLDIMYRYEADFTNTFRNLTIRKLSGIEIFNTREFIPWKKKWDKRLGEQSQTIDESKELMRKNNPAVIPRNHRVEEALGAAVEEGDLSVMDKFLNILKDPYAYSKDQEEYSKLPPPSSLAYKTFCGT